MNIALMKWGVLAMAGSLAAAGAVAQIAPPVYPLTMSKYIAGIKPVKSDQRIPYGPAKSQFGDLFLPKNVKGPAPVVILVHGGCWQAGVPAEAISGIAADLAEHGVAVWSIEYRRIGEPGGGYPNIYLDVGAAFDKLADIAKTYPLDLSNVIAVGHSSGAHLATWASARGRLPVGHPWRGTNPLKVKTVVMVNGLADLEHNADLLPLACGTDIKLADVIGEKTPARPDPFADTSPNKWLPLGIRTLMIVGTYDPIVPPYTGLWWHKLASKAGDKVDIVDIPDAGHFDIVTPTEPEWAQAPDLILAEVKR
jgi:acetyl esterase/lipase